MLQIDDLTKTYAGPVTALRGVSMELSPGLFGLLGPNGAGKTTLMRILAGLLEPTSGRVLLDGEDVTAHPERLWPRLGYLPQDFDFYPRLTGRAMLRHLLELKGVGAPGGLHRLCDQLLERVNLSGAAERKVKTYSGGMKRRLGIAQALAGDPRLLVVDEPTAGLDPEERLRFHRLLAETARDRIVLLSTHIVEEVAVLCSRFAVLSGGRIVAETSPSEAVAALEGRLFEGAMEPGTEGLEQALATRSHLREGRLRTRLLLDSGTAPPQDFEPVAPSLEDAYLQILRTPSPRSADGAAG